MLKSLGEKINANVLIFLFCAFAVLLSCLYLLQAYQLNHFFSFPLDDAWIHLQFAKNLADYGSFSYFKNEIVTSGSTSPLYTFILALGFLITRQEMFLSYVLGIAFFCASLFFFYQILARTFTTQKIFIVLGCLLFILDKWLTFIALSGMETTLYLFLLLSAFYYYNQRNAILLGITLGLAFWTRPDALAFIFALLVDYLYLLICKKTNPLAHKNYQFFSKSEIVKIISISTLIILTYFLFNLIISNSFLPNTYGAKLAYYPVNFTTQLNYLNLYVWQYFTESAYLLIIVPFFVSIVKITANMLNKKYDEYFFSLCFCFALIGIYFFKLPYTHLYGRYLMPIIPFYIIVSLAGTSYIFDLTARRFSLKTAKITLLIYAVITISFFSRDYLHKKDLYIENSKFFYKTHVETAKWLEANSDPKSIIATHDIGAIAFYSKRKVIDVLGLTNPEFIAKVKTKDYLGFLRERLKNYNVSLLVILANWLKIVNQNPLFVSGVPGEELLRTYQYTAEKTHILVPQVDNLIKDSQSLLEEHKFADASKILEQALSLDSHSSLTYYLLAQTAHGLGDNQKAVFYLKKALEIFPEYREAEYTLTRLRQDFKID